jgi:hypothetical protein
VVPDASGRVTIFIADYYNGSVRAVSPDGVIREVGTEDRVKFDAPARVAFAPKRGWLWVADSSLDRLVPLRLHQPAAPPPPSRRPAPPSPPLPARRIAPVSAPVSAPLPALPPAPKRVGG